MSIILKGLSKRFGNLLVVNRISLEIQDGELFVLLGASGSGKSTILRMIAGLSRPDAGTIELNGKDVTKWSPQSRGAGFVFQNYSLFRHMNVGENIEFGLKIRNAPAHERRNRRDELLEMVGLGGLGNRYPHQLSGGQQQRVALARALAYQPEVLLLDEPFGALDVKIRGQLRKTLRDIQHALKLTTILVTHDQEEAFELADRIGVMERGNLVESGSPEQLYHAPRTEFVANFVGGRNVLIGRVENGVITLGNTVLAVSPTLAAQSRVRILFRPETVLLQAEPFDPQSGVFVLGQGKVMERVFVGSFQKIRLEVERPHGIRPYAQDQFGEQTMQIEAIRPSDANQSTEYNAGNVLWVGFKNYHILETYWPKLLLCMDDSKSAQAVPDFGCTVAQRARSHAALLRVADSPEEATIMRQKLETVRQSWLETVPELETRIRQGDGKDEILLEIQEGHYEIVVVGRKESKLKSRSGLGTTVHRILQEIRVPVVIVQKPRKTISRILICSAVGEPGKADVRIGGRLARLLGASVGVLHAGGDPNADHRKRIDRHLLQALSTLDTFGVKSESKIGTGPVVDAILNEAEAGKYDLIVVGAPAPESPYRMSWQNATSQIVNRTKLPVMIVPMAD